MGCGVRGVGSRDDAARRTCSIVHAVTEVIATIPHLSSVPSVNGSSTSQMIISSRMIATYPGGHGVFLIRSQL